MKDIKARSVGTAYTLRGCGRGAGGWIGRNVFFEAEK